MLIKQSNKGFTLVELIVSMCILAIVMTELMALMFNSSKLYKNGAMEVDLQTEAQQIIQQFEELAIDANSSVSYNETTGIITIVNNPGTSYSLSLNAITGKDYGDLYLNDGSTNQLMGEYVKSISLDMADYDDASRIRIMVEMENDKYSYGAAKDLYLRNDLGANDGNTSHTVSTSCKYSLNVLRYHTYELNGMFESGSYIYAFDQDSHPEFDFTGPSQANIDSWTGTSFKVSTSSTFNNSAANDSKQPQYEVNAYEYDAATDTYSVAFKIKVYCEPVNFGMDGSGLVVVPNTSTNFDNYFSVQGISIAPADLSSIDFDMCCKIDVNSSQVTSNNLKVYPAVGQTYTLYKQYLDQNWSVDNLTIQSMGTVTGTSNLSGDMDKKPSDDFCYKINDNGTESNYIQMKIFGTKFKLDAANNDFVCVNNIQYQGKDNLENFILKYGVPYIKVTFHYASPNRSYELKLYPYPVGPDGGWPPSGSVSYSGDVQNRFFDMAK